jgi:hypothetical protein
MPTTTATPAADTIARELTTRPDGATVRELTDASGLSASTVAKTLTAMREAGTATRTPGVANGNRKAADLWHATTTDQPADTEATPTTPDAPTTDQPATDEADDDRPTADQPATDDDAHSDGDRDEPGTIADTGTPDEAPDEPADEPVPAEAPVSAPPAGPRQPDLKVLIMAGVLGDHPDGVSAHEAITASGLAPGVGDTILAAMEVAGAARRLPVDDDGIELWVRGDGDLATVDPANAPTHVTCPTCGHMRRVRRPSATVRRSAGTGRPTGDINSDGSEKLAKNGLRHQVEAFMRNLGTGHHVTPGTVARELGGRSSGAVGNAMNRLTNTGVLIMTSEAPVMYALAADAPAPSPELRAYLTIAAPDAADETTPATADEATPAELLPPVAALAA